MKDLVDDMNNIANNFPLPCQEMSFLFYQWTPWVSNDSYESLSFPISVMYPDKMKIITQSQALDGHALIGNIGGYIGLFLGSL